MKRKLVSEVKKPILRAGPQAPQKGWRYLPEHLLASVRATAARALWEVH